MSTVASLTVIFTNHRFMNIFVNGERYFLNYLIRFTTKYTIKNPYCYTFLIDISKNIHFLYEGIKSAVLGKVDCILWPTRDIHLSQIELYGLKGSISRAIYLRAQRARFALLEQTRGHTLPFIKICLPNAHIFYDIT